MGTFYEGDRVRLGEMRGGIVVRHEGRLRVRFPHSGSRLLWLDHCVPDEGPDGRIFPNTWNLCEDCGNPTRSAFVCINCAQRLDATDARPAQVVVWHVAGPVERVPTITLGGAVAPHLETVRQRCAQCGATLRAYCTPNKGAIVTGMFPVGALVWQSEIGTGPKFPHDVATEPTCTPVREAVTA